MSARIAILLATYNGERFIREQVDSILKQTCEEWHLYVHDDGSKDNTVTILNELQQSHQDRITIFDYPPQGGAFANFMSLLKKAEAEYYMFCDQDDLWHCDKVEKSLTAIKAIESKNPGKPVVVHSDLRVVDENGRMLAPSFWSVAGIHPEMFKTFGQRITNVVTGCTMLFNQPAKECAMGVSPDGHPLHDEWVTIRSAAEGGIIAYLPETLIDYRQHESNTLGAEACYNRKTAVYYMTNLKQAYKENKANYRVLRSAGYKSPWAYVANKIRNMIVYHLNY